MFGLIKELVDRFIEFVLMFARGDSAEEKLTSALKSSIFLVAILLWGMISLVMSNFNMRSEIEDMQAGIVRMNQLFDRKEGGPIATFVRINDSLTRSLNLAKEENLILTKNNIQLKDETNFLRPLLFQALSDGKRINKNNDLLIKLCVPDPALKKPK